MAEERILWLREEHPELVETLARYWPLGVPTLRGPHTHSVEELDAINAVLAQVEAGARLPFSEQLYPGLETKEQHQSS